MPHPANHDTDLWGRALLAATPDLIFLLDRDGRFIDVLTFSNSQLAMPRERFIGKTVKEVMPPDVVTACTQAISQLTREGEVKTFNYELIMKGEKRWFEGRVALCDANHVVVIARDFTEQRQAEEALRHSQRMLAEAQRIAGLGTWEDDRKNMALSWSDETYRIFGETPKTLKPSVDRFFEYVHPDDRDAVRAAFIALLEQDTRYDVIHRIVRKDGEVRWVREQAECFRDEDGNPTRLVGTTLDVTEQTLARKKLREANTTLERRAEQLRRLTLQLSTTEQRERKQLAAVLHDNLQQLLVAARCHIAILAGGAHGEQFMATARQAQDVLTSAINECQSLTIELRPPVLREGGLAHALEWLGIRMAQMHGLTVVVSAEETEEVDDTLCTVLFNAVRELLLNVVKHSGVNSARVEMLPASSGRIRLTVSDEGAGFDPVAIEASEGQAGGFGLFAIRETMQSLGGNLEVSSTPGKGSCFTLTAPVTAYLSPFAEQVPRHKAVGGQAGLTPAQDVASETERGIRVLLADDHQIVRQGLAQLLLQHPAFQVAGEASDGEAAVNLTRQLQPDVVLMDVNMKGMNGVEATRTIHAEFPDIVVIGLSMYKEDHRAEEMRAAGAAAYVSKDEAAEVLIDTALSCCR